MSTNITTLNGTTTLEFPLWRPLIAILNILFFGVLLPTTLFFNISLFVALVKSTMKHKPLLVLYGSLLLGLCVDKLLSCVEESVDYPSIIRYCECMKVPQVLFILSRVFFVVYSVVVVTCQSVLQLLIMKGSKEWQNSYKRSFRCLIISAAVATFWTVAFFISNIVSESPIHCYSLCASLDNRNFMDASLFVVAAYGIFTLIPAFLVTIVTSIWAFLVFKKKFMITNKEDVGLSRRILLIPVIMVFLLFCNSLLGYLAIVVSDRVLDRASLEPFFGNWANYWSIFLYFVLDMLHALSYPLVLLFLYTRLRKTWKSLFSCSKQSLNNNNSCSNLSHKIHTLTSELSLHNIDA